jgi:hypothetical protein
MKVENYKVYPGRDSNPHSRDGHRILSPACLPFHHPGATLNKIGIEKLLLGAKDETRTRDPHLGKVMLYQLSYFRKYFKEHVSVYLTDCKDSNLFIFGNSNLIFFYW